MLKTIAKNLPLLVFAITIVNLYSSFTVGNVAAFYANLGASVAWLLLYINIETD